MSFYLVLKPASNPFANPTSARVLIADDDVSVRQYLRSALEFAGYIVETVESIHLAIRLLSRFSFEVAIIDIHMPVQSGLDLIEVLQKEYPDTVPLIVSESDEAVIAIKGMISGTFDYLKKPVDQKKICETVKRAVEESNIRKRGDNRKLMNVVWQSYFDQCHDAIAIIDAEERICRMNSAFEQYVNIPFTVQFRPELPHFLGQFEGAIKECVRLSTSGQSIPEIQLIDPISGEEIILEVIVIRIPFGNSMGTILVCRNLTALSRSEAIRERLCNRYFSVQEDVRRHIARELHDGVGQSLASLNYGLAAIANEVESAEIKSRMKRILGAASDAMSEFRRSAHGLNPAVFETLGLPEALSRLVNQFSQVNNIWTEIEVIGTIPTRLPIEIESSAYRIVQEALSNVLKHSQASFVHIKLILEDRTLQLLISDNGKGMNENSSDVDVEAGMGIADMRERATLLNGSFHLESQLNQGVSISISIPIPRYAFSGCKT